MDLPKIWRGRVAVDLPKVWVGAVVVDLPKVWRDRVAVDLPKVWRDGVVVVGLQKIWNDRVTVSDVNEMSRRRPGEKIIERPRRYSKTHITRAHGPAGKTFVGGVFFP